MTEMATGRRPLVSIVVPVYFNEETLEELHGRFVQLAEDVPDCDWEFIFVDDGSKDGSFRVLSAIREKDGRTGLVKLARNYGSHAAILAGMSVAKGDAVAFVTADLQDDPMLLREMVADWRNGSPVVMAVREGREDSFKDRLFAKLYYKAIRRVAIPDMPEDGYDFALLDRQVVDILVGIREKNTTLTGLIVWLGFPHTLHPYTRKAREKGRSRWTIAKKVKLLVDSVVSFSYFPVRLMSVLGIMISLAAFLYAGFLIVHKIIRGFPVEGWTSLMVVLLIVSGIQLIALGVLGEYIWRTLDASRGRPPFVIHRNVQSRYSRENERE